MADTGMTLQVSKELILPVIEQKIQSAIVAELSGDTANRLIASITERVLTQKVNSEGTPDSYGYSSSKTYIQWLCEGAIKECARGAVKRWAEANKEKLEKVFASELQKRNAGMAKAMMDGIEKCMTASWSFTVNVGFNSEK